MHELYLGWIRVEISQADRRPLPLGHGYESMVF